jgi:prepilin-type N-terminal cleavage/methylation domain-containing protein
MYHRSSHHGVTLIEVLIVIAIIGMLVQLMLPAVQSAREAGRRTACQNNLRQIGLAALSHESALGYLPTAGWGWAWIGDPDRGPGKSQPGSWAYQLLPYMEQRAVYEIGLGAGGGAKYDALARLAATPVPLFYCPTRRGDDATPNNGPQVDVAGFSAGDLFWYNARKPARLARTDYKANVGDTFAFWSEGPPPELAEQDEGFFDFKVGQDRFDPEYFTGVVIQRQPILFSQVFDGLSKTYFAGEKFLPTDHYDTGQSPLDDQSCWNGDDLDLVASTKYIPRRDAPTTAKLPGLVGIPFGSAHPDGLSMVLCDASIRFIGYDIDPEVHRQLGNRRNAREPKQGLGVE